MGYEKIMKKYWKRIIVVIIVMIYMSMLVSAVIVNIKYREYISVTELGMSETYDYENAGFSARIDAYKCVTLIRRPPRSTLSPYTPLVRPVCAIVGGYGILPYPRNH